MKQLTRASKQDVAEVDTQVVGFGVAALGIPIVADRLGCLEQLLRDGLLFIEANASLSQWTSLSYAVESNSPASDFLSAFSESGMFASTLARSEGRKLRERGHMPLPLLDVAAFFRSVAEDFLAFAGRFEKSGALFGQRVGRVAVQPSGCVITYGDDDRPLVRSRRVVLALGSTEGPPYLSGSSESVRRVPILSEDILRRREHDRICQAIRDGQPIDILGGRHSAFSVAHYLLSEFGRGLRHGQVTIHSNSGVRFFHPSIEQAEADGLDVSAQCVDPGSGQVNRLIGLRGEAARLARAVLAGTERRVVLTRHWSEECSRRDALCIHAAGYKPRQVCLTDANGKTLELLRKGSTVALDPEGALLDRQGIPIPGVFGLGHGYATPSAQGPLVGVNYFHEAAISIVQGALARDSYVAWA